MAVKLAASGLAAAALAAGTFVVGAPAASATTATTSADHSTSQVHAAATPNVEYGEDGLLGILGGESEGVAETFAGESEGEAADSLLGLEELLGNETEEFHEFERGTLGGESEGEAEGDLLGLGGLS